MSWSIPAYIMECHDVLYQVMAKISLWRKRRIEDRIYNHDISIWQIAARELYGGIEMTDKTQWLRLNLAACDGLDDLCLNLLINCPHDLNRTTDFGETSLHLACMKANHRCIEHILHFRPEINTQNKHLLTPLNSFVGRPPRNEYILKKLLDAGANPNIPDKDGFSSLHTLAIQHETDKTKLFACLLVQYKANVNSKNKLNETPLHLAVLLGKRGLVDVFVNIGASVDIPDKYGNTPIDMALESAYMYPTIYDLVAKHLIIQYCCGFPVNLKHLEKVCENETHRIFKKCCEEEKQKLKITFAGESAVTLDNILVSSTHKVAKYLLNSNIIMSLEKFTMEESFLGPILKKKYEVALERCNGIKLGIVAFNKIFPFLPHPCVDMLMEYLDNQDFSNLHKACFC